MQRGTHGMAQDRDSNDGRGTLNFGLNTRTWGAGHLAGRQRNLASRLWQFCHVRSYKPNKSGVWLCCVQSYPTQCMPLVSCFLRLYGADAGVSSRFRLSSILALIPYGRQTVKGSMLIKYFVRFLCRLCMDTKPANASSCAQLH